MPFLETCLDKDIPTAVSAALLEDVGTGDITASLIPENVHGTAQVITREACTACGTRWVDETFRQVDEKISVIWNCKDGSQLAAGQNIFKVEGSLRGILTAERTALNFFQLLSGTATSSASYAKRVKHTNVKLLDTRKTIPGLRYAQKYAVTCGGCHNHRLGLYDAFLIKENHIKACGSISAAVLQAKASAPDKPIEVEVENMTELDQALSASADIIMLDNFNLKQLQDAVSKTAGQAKLEASGGITDENLVTIAETGVDYISIGALTKHLRAIDLS
jgi:nicotinate-nucleotide pyrophosphorylase (carboxylating)